MNRPIYLDYNATTPVDPAVLDAMMLFLKEAYGNSASTTHAYGWEAQAAVDKARGQAAKLIGCKPKNIIWTSGATESNNLAILSPMRRWLAEAHSTSEKPHLITSLMEHKAVLDVAHALEAEGAEATFIAPDAHGMILAENVAKAIRPNTKLISIIFGQNEIGTINPIAEIGALCRKHNILFHVDAAQALGKAAIDVDALNIDFLSASGHKMYAPKGVGFLYVREGLKLDPLFFGGAQERGIRPGTVNVSGVVAMGKACEICSTQMPEEVERLTRWRDNFIKKILAEVPSARLNGHPTQRLYSNINMSFQGLDPEVFALGLSGLAVSSGSACSAGAPSHILSAIGLSNDLNRATIRIGIGRFTKESDLATAFDKIVGMVKKYG